MKEFSLEFKASSSQIGDILPVGGIGQLRDFLERKCTSFLEELL